MKKTLKRMTGILLAAGMVLGATACGGKSSGSETTNNSGASGSTSTSDSAKNTEFAGQTLVLLGYGGSVQDAMVEAWAKPFEEEYGVTVKSVSPPDEGQLQAMGEAGKVDYDVCIEDPGIIMKMADLGYIEKIDYSGMDKANFGEGYYTDYWVAADIYTTSICWNTDSYKDAEAPSTWADLWDDSKRKGDLVFYNYPELTLESALIADGVTQDKLYPLDLDRAFKKLDEVKDNVRTWYDTGEQSAQSLGSGETAAGGLWVGRALAAKANGDPIDVTFNQSIIGIDALCVFKDCNNPKLAMEFIKYVTGAQKGADFMTAYPYYGVVNNKAYDLISDDVKKTMCVLPEYRDKQFALDYDYWYKNMDSVLAEWNTWITK